MTTIVLMGAGASFGSDETLSAVQKPPLGNGEDGLFARLETFGGVASTLHDSLKAEFRENFEIGMAAYYQQVNGNIMRFQREMAAYLASFQPAPASVYLKLIQALGTHRVIYATLNYDLLFEQSAAAAGYEFVNYEVAKRRPGPRLLKPHGSCNFWPAIHPSVLANVSFAGNGRGDFEGEVKPLSQSETLHRCRVDTGLAPGMAVYAEGKSVRVCGGFVERQQVLLREAIRVAKRVFVVGVRVNPVDHHIWGEIANSPARVTYFGRTTDRGTFDDWAGVRRNGSHFVEATFSECVPIIRSIVFG